MWKKVFNGNLRGEVVRFESCKVERVGIAGAKIEDSGGLVSWGTGCLGGSGSNTIKIS
jgi:hypothetical protein